MPRLSFNMMEGIIASIDKPELEGPNYQKERVKLIIKRVIAEQLTARQRQLCVLYFFDGLDMPTIAETLNINKSTVSRTIARALKNINDRVRYLRLR